MQVKPGCALLAYLRNPALPSFCARPGGALRSHLDMLHDPKALMQSLLLLSLEVCMEGCKQAERLRQPSRCCMQSPANHETLHREAGKW